MPQDVYARGVIFVRNVRTTALQYCEAATSLLVYHSPLGPRAIKKRVIQSGLLADGVETPLTSGGASPLPWGCCSSLGVSPRGRYRGTSLIRKQPLP